MKTSVKVSRVNPGGWFTLSFLFVVLSGCATYQGKVAEARRLIQSGNPTGAVEKLKPLASQEGKDQLVYLLDYGTALQQSGDFSGSTKVLLKADEMADYKDYHSVSKQGASLLLSQEMVQYKGDDFEKVLINAMLAYNFLMQGDLDGAMVETRRINEKIQYFVTERKKKFTQNVFAIYLGALIYEAQKKWDDAYISYEQAFNIDNGIPMLHQDLVNASARAQRWDTHAKWKKEFGLKLPKDWKQRRNMGEVVLVMQQGWGPRKYPRPNAPRFPKLFPVNSRTQAANLIIEGEGETRSQVISSIERVAIKALDDDYASLVAKRVAGLVAKEIAADQIRQRNEGLGALAAILMHASDRADLRQWSTLPESFQVAKMPLPPGRYQILVQGVDASGNPSGEEKKFTDVEVVKGKKTFLGWRSVR